MHDVDRERHDEVARQENDNVPQQQNLAAQPLPVDEAGLETGQDAMTGDTRPDRYEEETAQEPTEPEPARDTAAEHDAELFDGETVTRLRERWRELQADFVDDPQQAVRAADEVVDEVLRTITEHRQRLAGEWQGHTDTEHLRLAMREYRAFVDRLLPTT